HLWGISVYACEPGAVRLERILVGHEGDVMSVAPSADGRLLVSASRDQTVACWSLEDWPRPSQPVLGASFRVQGGRLFVRHVDPGSPAWELGLQDEHEIVVCVVPQTEFVYNVSGKKLSYYHINVKDPTRPASAAATAAELENAPSNRE